MRSEQENTDSNNYAPSPRIKNALLNSSRTLGCRLSEFKKIDSGQHGQTYWVNFIWQIDEQLRLDLKYEAHQAYLKQTFNEQPENIPLRWEKESPPTLKFSGGICYLTETQFQQFAQQFHLEGPFIKKLPLSWKRAVYNFLKIKVSLIPQWINDKPWYGWKMGLATAVILVLVVGLFVLLPASEKKQLELAETYNNQVIQYYQEGQFQQAQSLAEKAFKIRQDILGEKHPDTLASLNNLARIYQKLDRLNEALPLYEKSYRLSAKKTDKMEEKLRNFQVRWKEANRFGLSANKQLSPATQAFGAGLWISKEALLGHHQVALPERLLPPAPYEHWSKTDWQDYFELGRWTFLLWTASQFPPAEPKIFWDKQRDIFAQLKKAFEERQTAGDNKANKAKKVVFQLENFVEPLLRKLLLSEGSKMSRRDLDNLEGVMKLLAPQ